MDIQAVLTEVIAAIDSAGIAGLRSYDFGPESVTVPCVITMLPDSIEYHFTGGLPGGGVRFEFPLIVLAGRPTERTSGERLLAYVSTTGDSSLFSTVESYAYTSCDDVTIVSMEKVVDEWNGTEYLGAALTLSVMGQR